MQLDTATFSIWSLCSDEVNEHSFFTEIIH